MLNGGIRRWEDRDLTRSAAAAAGVPVADKYSQPTNLGSGLNRYRAPFRSLVKSPAPFYPTGAELTAETATFTLSGGIVLWGSRLLAETGTFTLTGANVVLDRTLDAETVSYALTGGDAQLAASYELIAGSADYSLNVGDANFQQASGIGQPIRSGWNVWQSAGSFLSAPPKQSTLVFTAETGAFVLSVADATFQVTSNQLVAETGGYVYAGADAGLTAQYVLAAESGAFVETGGDVAFISGNALTAESGSYSLAGADIGLLTGNSVELETGAYLLSGADASLQYSVDGPTLNAESAAFAVTGGDLEIDLSLILSAETATFALTGGDAELTKQYELIAEPASYLYSGDVVSFALMRHLNAIRGDYLLSGANASLIYSESTDIGRKPGIVIGTIPRSINKTTTSKGVVSSTPKRSVHN